MLVVGDPYESITNHQLGREAVIPQQDSLSWRCLLLTSLAEEPETSIQVLEKKAQEPSMNTMYTTAWTGSSSTEPNDSGGDR